MIEVFSILEFPDTLGLFSLQSPETLGLLSSQHPDNCSLLLMRYPYNLGLRLSCLENRGPLSLLRHQDNVNATLVAAPRQFTLAVPKWLRSIFLAAPR